MKFIYFFLIFACVISSIGAMEPYRRKRDQILSELCDREKLVRCDEQGKEKLVIQVNNRLKEENIEHDMDLKEVDWVMQLMFGASILGCGWVLPVLWNKKNQTTEESLDCCGAFCLSAAWCTVSVAALGKVACAHCKKRRNQEQIENIDALIAERDAVLHGK